MKLIGVIAVLLVLSAGCQKEDIRPNASNPALELRSATDPNAGTVGEGGVIDESTGGSITDPNDANRSNKSPKPKQ